MLLTAGQGEAPGFDTLRRRPRLDIGAVRWVAALRY